MRKSPFSSWKKLPNHKVPRWVKRKKANHVRGKTYFYRRRGKIWQRRIREEWEDRIGPWQYILIGFFSALAAALISGIILFYFFR